MSYSDPRLHDRAALLELAKDLQVNGLIQFRTHRRTQVGVFTVYKKGNRLRLVFDSRQTNAFCYRPPKTRLASPSAFSNLRLPSEPSLEKKQSSGVSEGRPYRGCASAIDLVDAFDAFEVDNLAEHFAFEHSYTAAEVGICRTRDDEGNEYELEPSDRAWPCCGALAMGFSWALHFLPRGYNKGHGGRCDALWPVS